LLIQMRVVPNPRRQINPPRLMKHPILPIPASATAPLRATAGSPSSALRPTTLNLELETLNRVRTLHKPFPYPRMPRSPRIARAPHPQRNLHARVPPHSADTDSAIL